jgi:hypothetical protein
MKPISALALVGLTALTTLSACSTASKTEGGMELELFNGKNLRGWKHVLADPAVPREQVWTVQDGLIVCRGTPLGVLHTERTFTDFRLEVEYRWAPGASPGNSGIFSRINGPPRALPRCVEVQLAHGSAGDLLTLQGMKMDSSQPRYFHVAQHELAGDIDGVKKLQDAEAAPGQWNHVTVVARGSSYGVWVNGQKVNEATGVETLAGPVGLQSEGGEIHFRRVTLTPLDAR